MNKRISQYLYIILFLLLPIYCFKNKQEKNFTATFLAMGGIPIEIVVSGVTNETFTLFMDEAEKRVNQWENELSMFKPESVVNKICHSPGKAIKLSDYTWTTLSMAKEFWMLSHGKFDITIGPLIELWKYSEKKNEIPSEASIRAVRTIIGFQHLIFNENDHSITYMPILYIEPSLYLLQVMNYWDCSLYLPDVKFSIDVGGIAKGLFAQWLKDDFLKFSENRAEKPSKFIANIGGDMYCVCFDNGCPCTIGIQDPFGKGLWGEVEIKNNAIVTSGTYERFFNIKGKSYCHIINPETGHPINTSLVSVTIIDPSGVAADALATIFFLLGEREGIKLISNRPDSEAVIIRKNGSWLSTERISKFLTKYNQAN